MPTTARVPRRLRRVSTTAARRVRRRLRPAFDDRPGHLVVHACHHKAGTVFFRNVVATLAHHHGLRLEQASHQRRPSAGTDLFLQDHSKLDVEALPAFRGTHVVRDPRDIVVSAYHYHLWTHEPWAHEPRDEFDGRSYQQELRRLPADDGLALEIEHTAFTVADMRAWDYDDPRFLELRFEDLLADEQAVFAQVFRHWGLSESAVQVGLRAVAHHTFDRAKARESSDGPSHLRRGGGQGEWRELFDDRHHARMAELCGDLLVRLGYEPGGPDAGDPASR